MYRLVLYYLLGLLALAVIFGAVGILPYSPVDIVLTTLFLLVVAWAANGLLAAAFKAHPNVESVYITALILALIITPGSLMDASFVIFLLCAATLAMASKYILSFDKKHLFNPAAIAVLITAFTIGQSASWWVGGNLPLMAFVIAGGFLIVRKVQRFDLALTFIAAAFISGILTHPSVDPMITLQKIVLHTPLFFFAAVMITEPLTTPPTRVWRMEYAALVGLIFSPAAHLGTVYSTPELALVIGNLFSYMVSPKGKHVLMLVNKEKVGEDIYDFSFAPEAGKKLSFLPGQYLEWTLAHGKPDARGNRRYFTIASSPTEKEILLGVKFYEPASTFKKNLLAMKPGDTIVAGQLAGDFTLPSDPRRKLAFIAGGIGITPFRSMVKYLTDTAMKKGKNYRRDVVLFYSNRDVDEIAYREVFDEAAEKIGMRTIYTVTGNADGSPGLDGNNNDMRHGRITADLIRREMPDYRERTFYVSGTHAMTTVLKNELSKIGIPRKNIKIDFFPGFV